MARREVFAPRLMEMPQQENVVSFVKAPLREAPNHLDGQPCLVLEVGLVEARLRLPDEAIAELFRNEVQRHARNGILGEGTPEAVRKISLVQEISVRRQKASTALDEHFFVD